MSSYYATTSSLTWPLAYSCGQQQNQCDKKCRQIDDDFDGHGDAAVQPGAHRSMEHIQGFTWSHWMPPLVECSHCITPAAAMVKEFESNTQNTNKTQLLASNYGKFLLLVVCENFNPKTNPLLSSSMRQASCKCEMPRFELKSSRKFSSYQTLSADKNSKIY